MITTAIYENSFTIANEIKTFLDSVFDIILIFFVGGPKGFTVYLHHTILPAVQQIWCNLILSSSFSC